MNNATSDTQHRQELPFQIKPGDVIVGDEAEIEFKTYVEEKGLVRFYDHFDRERSDGVASFKRWLGEQDELTIRRG